MAVERTGVEPRPLLPDSLVGRLQGWAMRGLGLGLGLLAAAGWLSLMTWSAADPSLTHVTTGTTRNLLGPIGAILSDILLQTIGFTAVVAFLGPAFASGELFLNERLPRLRTRSMLFLASLLVLAGALSSLPSPGSWPINHGFGGALGDRLFDLAAGLTGIVLPGRGGVLAGLLLFAGGMCLLSAGLGLDQNDWAVLARSAHRPARLAADVGEPSGFASATIGNGHGDDAVSGPYEPQAALSRDDASPLSSTGPLPVSDQAGHEPAFDQATDVSSRSIARRFAPPSAVNAPAQTPARPAGGRSASQVLGSLFSPRAAADEYRRPSLNILKRPPPARPGSEHAQPVLRGNARLLEDVLGDFGIKGEVKAVNPGPVVTLFEVEPARGTKSSRVIALSEDIARSMSAASARVAVVAGRNAIGIELPNLRRATVFLRELLESDAWRHFEGQLPVVLGKSIAGEPVIADLARMPHLLVAGTTGSGKSVGVNALILSLLFRLSPAECRLLMIDPKMLELSAYNGIPHLLAPVVTDPHRAAAALAWAVSEMEERYKRMAQLGVRNIEMFNVRLKNARKRGELTGRMVQTGFDEWTGEAVFAREELTLEPMPYIVIIVDEFADLMAVAGKEVEGSVQRLAQMARAAGIHLVMATQRPSVDVVTGTIKANFPTRIAFKVASRIDSRTIIGDQGAEQLLGAGDMLYSAGSGQIVRVHGPFVSDEEVEQVAESLRAQGAPAYVDALAREADPLLDADEPGRFTSAAGPTAADDLFDRAVAIVHRDGKASTSYLQRRLAIGYNRAADLIERMEQAGIVSPADSVGRRRVLIGGHGADASAS
ncbi:MAG: DNA translocase FtsK 4TM domain-containing protein [Hyphomicrobiaceae bacterium]|nr:DNA translocase FtsK 4TM domain-containing protein [Hyphomicrobiaceae bacterium]